MTASRSTQTKSRTINLRVTPGQRDLIDQAAAALGKDRTDFILEASTRSAEDVLRDRTFFALSDDAYDQFVAMLDAPSAPLQALRELMARKAPWE